ncbi:MAG TPA: hypothetical protein VFQ85_08395 [Mycobacteriales bacterium]|jgi:hypothetical protein|nr:hypothetical protein [Mycobacteriales bacterium]
MGSRVRGAAVVALLLLGIAPGARAAAPPLLTVSGDHSAGAAITLTTRTTLDFEDALVTTHGGYAVLTLYSAAGREVGGVARLPELTDPAQPDPLAPPTVLGSGLVTLDPGRYRLYLLTDASTTVTVPLLAGEGSAVTPTAPLRATHSAARTSVTRPTATLRLPLAERRGAVTLAVAQYTAGTANLGTHTLRLCFTRRGRACVDGLAYTGQAVHSSQIGYEFNSPPRHGNDLRAELRTAPTAPPPAPTDTLGLVLLQYDVAR